MKASNRAILAIVKGFVALSFPLILSAHLTGCNAGKASKIQEAITRNTPSTNWDKYNGDGARSHFTKLGQITRENVGRLKVAWTYSSVGADSVLEGTQMQCNPIIVDGILYGVSAKTQVFALDAATGKELWKTEIVDNGGTTSRGVTYYTDGKAKIIFFGAGQWLYAINAETGELSQTFGNLGKIDLKAGINRPHADDYVVSNTPNTIFKISLLSARGWQKKKMRC